MNLFTFGFLIIIINYISVNADDEPICTWRGAAPFCSPSECRRGEFEASAESSNDDPKFGSKCLTGTKKRCCKMKSCYFSGSAPFCSPSWCKGSDIQIGEHEKGDGYPCITGKKKICCPNELRRKVKVTLYEHANHQGWQETYSEDVGCINLEHENQVGILDTHGECIRVYNQKDCKGHTTALYPGPNGLFNLNKIGFNDDVKSVGPCYAHDRETDDLQKRDFQFFKDTVWIGLIPDNRNLENHRNLDGPVNFYQTNGLNGRTESMEALITRNHLGTGTATNQNARDYAQRLGRADDDAGHILGSNLGGSGVDLRNIFPQTRNINRGVFAQFERTVADIVNLHGSVIYNINLEYEDDNSTRPIRILARIQYNDTYTGILTVDDQDFINF